VRELENLLHRAVALTDADLIEASDLGLATLAGDLAAEAEAEAPSAPPPAETRSAPALPSDLAAHLDAVEKDIIERALERHRYNRTAAGASLGLSLRQMRYRMARLGIGVGDDDGPGA
jgi:two-component system response regulator PilR (NtrC family)